MLCGTLLRSNIRCITTNNPRKIWLQTPPHYFTISNNEKCLVRTENNNKDEKSSQEPNRVIQIVKLVIQILLDSF